MLGALVPAWLALAFLSFRLSHPDNFVFARWSLHTPYAKCIGLSPSAGVLQLLAAFSGMSELLAPEREALGITIGKCLTTGSSMLLAETSTAGLLIVPVPLDSSPELPAPD
jgi:hypothetical protein